MKETEIEEMLEKAGLEPAEYFEYVTQYRWCDNEIKETIAKMRKIIQTLEYARPTIMEIVFASSCWLTVMVEEFCSDDLAAILLIDKNITFEAIGDHRGQIRLTFELD